MSQSSRRESNPDIPPHALNVDFDDLAKHDAEWAAIAKSARESKWLDFKDPKVVRQLTKAILKRDFHLSLELPDDRLCPPVPVRWNYIRWIQDLLDTTAEGYTEGYDAEREVVGVDIGTGASAIYALLGCSTRPNWRMAGTDIDTHSLSYAKKNIEANELTKNIKLLPSHPDAPLIPIDKLGLEELDFVMTNPPFYASQADKASARANKTEGPAAVNFASESESITRGGDIGFVTRLLTESLVLRERVHWYTAMLAKLASLQQIVAKLKAHGITNFAVTNLQAGHRTRRWGIAWSFRDARPRNDVARRGELVHAVLPAATAHSIRVPLMSRAWAGRRVDKAVRGLGVRWVWRPLSAVGVVEAGGNVWSRAARRRMRFQEGEGEGNRERVGADGERKRAAGRSGVDDADAGADADDSEDGEDEDEEERHVALAVKITCKEGEVEVRWLRGGDHLLFESFCGMLKRALAAREEEEEVVVK